MVQKNGERVAGTFGYLCESSRFVVFEASAVVPAPGNIGKSFKVASNF